MAYMQARRLLAGSIAGIFALGITASTAALKPSDHVRIDVKASAGAVAGSRMREAGAGGPITDARHFDLDCDLRGRVISDPDPDNYHGTWPAGMRAWHDRTRFIVDLQAMRSCEPAACLYYDPPAIVSVTSERITFLDNPGAHIFVRMRDLQYRQRMEQFGGLNVTQGTCVKRRFSGFPPRLHS